jgi:hypothetical protein
MQALTCASNASHGLSKISSIFADDPESSMIQLSHVTVNRGNVLPRRTCDQGDSITVTKRNLASELCV